MYYISVVGVEKEGICSTQHQADIEAGNENNK
jgi:hypothetical protein